MKIKREIDLTIETKRRFVIRQIPQGRQIIFCAECGELTLKVEQAAVFFKIKQRSIFQIIETEAVHFSETENGAAMICLKSLSDVLESQTRNDQKILPEKNKH